MFLYGLLFTIFGLSKEIKVPVFKTCWLVDTAMNLVDDSFFDICSRLKVPVKTLDSSSSDYFLKADLSDYFPKKSCVVYLGSIGSVPNVFRQGWFPGAYRDLEPLQCSSYIAAINQKSDILLNRHYFFLPLSELATQISFIQKQFCLLDERIFIRPNSGNKVFSGQTINTENIENEIDLLKKTYKVDDSELCLISSNKKDLIEAEFRFVVVDGKVSAGSKYLPEEKTVKFRHSAFTFAQKCATLYQPDSVFTLDVCRLNNGDYKLIELNSFSCAGLYQCDYEDIIRDVSRQAKKEWNEMFSV